MNDIQKTIQVTEGQYSKVMYHIHKMSKTFGDEFSGLRCKLKVYPSSGYDYNDLPNGYFDLQSDVMGITDFDIWVQQTVDMFDWTVQALARGANPTLTMLALFVFCQDSDPKIVAWIKELVNENNNVQQKGAI